MKRLLFALTLAAIPSFGAADVGSVVTFPAGSNGDVQFNYNRRFGADPGYFTYSTGTHTLQASKVSVATITINGQTYHFPNTVCPGGTFFRLDGAGGVTCETTSTFITSTGVALGVADGGVLISSPTGGFDFSGNQFIISLQGATTAAVALNPSSVTLLGALVASAPIVLTGSTFSLDVSSVTMRGPDPALGGDLTGTISNASVTDDSHNHTSVSISGLDISADTNLAVSPPITLTGDTVGIDKSSVTLLGPTIDAAELPADGYASTYVNVAGDTMTGQLTVVSSVTVSSIGVTNSITGRTLTVSSNTILPGATFYAGTVQLSTVSIVGPLSANATLGTSGQFLKSQGTGAPAVWDTVSGVASSLAVSTGGAIISSPTVQIDFNASQFAGAMSGTTTQIALVASSVTLRGPNVINLQSSLQSGATFYVSSGTALNFTASTMSVINDLAVTDDATVGGGLTVSGGSGVTISGLTASRCVETDGSNRLVSAASACGTGGGGGSTNGTILSSTPTTLGVYSDTTTISGLAAGTSTQILMSRGASLNPYWTSELPSGSTNYIAASSSGSFLTTSSATATYLQNSSATATYVQISSANANFVSISSANANFLTQSSAAVTYAPISGSSNYIQNRETLQSGATFYVSSGTILNQLSIGTTPRVMLDSDSWDFYTSANALFASIFATNSSVGGSAAGIVFKDASNPTVSNRNTGGVNALNIWSPASTSTGTLRFYDGPDVTASHFVGIKSSVTMPASYTIALPNQEGSTNTFVNVAGQSGTTEFLQHFDLFGGTSTWTGLNTWNGVTVLNGAQYNAFIQPGHFYRANPAADGQLVSYDIFGGTNVWTGGNTIQSSTTFNGIVSSSLAVTIMNGNALNLQNANNNGNVTLQNTGSTGNGNLTVTASSLTLLGGYLYISSMTDIGGANFAGNVDISSGLLLSGAAGTNGQFLTSGGAGTIPTWTTPSPGGGGSNGIIVASTQNNVGYYSGTATNTISGLTEGTSGQILMWGVTGPPFWSSTIGVTTGTLSTSTTSLQTQINAIGPNLLASTQTWTGQNNWTTPAQSTFTYGLTAGSITVSGSGAGQIILTEGSSPSTGTLSANDNFWADSSSHAISATFNGSASTYTLVSSSITPVAGQMAVWTPSGANAWTLGTQAVGAGSGDMILASTQTNTGQKTFTSPTIFSGSVTFQNVSSMTFTNFSTFTLSGGYMDLTSSTMTASSGTITNLNLSTLQGVTPGLIAGTNITSITGAWPNQTINAATQSGGGASGTVNAANQFSAPYYSVAGSSNVLSGYSPMTLSTNSTVGVAISTSVTITSTGTTNALKITANGTYGTTNGTSGGLLLDCTGGAGASGYCAQIYSAAGTQNALQGLLNIVNSSNTYNEPQLYLIDNSSASGHPQIRIDAINPNIELINTNLGGNVKYEAAAIPTAGDYLQVNGRNAAGTSFEGISRWHRRGGPAGTNGALGFVALQLMTTGQLVLNDADDSNYVSLRASDTVASNLSFVLPDADGTNGQFIKTNGSGVLSFGTASGTGDAVLAATQTWTGQETWASPQPSTFTYGVAVGSLTVSGSTGNLTLTQNGFTGQVVISTNGAGVTVGHCAQFGSSMSIVDAGANCGTGAGSGGIVSPGTFTWTNNQGITGSTLTFTAFNTTQTSATVTGAGGFGVTYGITASSISLTSGTVTGLMTISTLTYTVIANSTSPTKTANYTMTPADSVIYGSATATTPSIIITLPSAATTVNQMATVNRVDRSSRTVQVLAQGTDLIAGTTAGIYLNAQGQSIQLQSDGSKNWWPIGRYPITPAILGYPETPNSAVALAASSDVVCSPFTVPDYVYVTTMTVAIGVAAGGWDIGIYDNNGAGVNKGNLLVHQGEKTTTTGIVSVDLSTAAVVLPPGPYWACVGTGGATTTFARYTTGQVDGPCCKFATSMPFPATFTWKGCTQSALGIATGILVNGGAHF